MLLNYQAANECLAKAERVSTLKTLPIPGVAGSELHPLYHSWYFKDDSKNTLFILNSPANELVIGLFTPGKVQPDGIPVGRKNWKYLEVETGTNKWSWWKADTFLSHGKKITDTTGAFARVTGDYEELLNLAVALKTVNKVTSSERADLLNRLHLKIELDNNPPLNKGPQFDPFDL